MMTVIADMSDVKIIIKHEDQLMDSCVIIYL